MAENVMNQFHRAWDALDQLANEPLAKLNPAIGPHPAFAKLDQALADAQNSPPLGEADGSVDPELWTMMRGLRVSLENAACLYRNAREKSFES